MIEEVQNLADGHLMFIVGYGFCKALMVKQWGSVEMLLTGV
ncbi:MAG TPA: hypothetical protein VJZ32_12970 [Candidatus Bathyarchaeia archaeon]|nr:hypothetical protein [Candidatus Bathyarchaeia archaeon]